MAPHRRTPEPSREKSVRGAGRKAARLRRNAPRLITKGAAANDRSAADGTASTSSFATSCTWRRRFRIHVVDDVFSPHGELAKLLVTRRTLVVSTPTVWSLYRDPLERLAAAVRADVRHFVLEVDERTKSIESALRICDACHAAGLGRTDALLALGGGVCSDLVTVAAALVRRGLPFVRVPTTLVGQIDAGVGIKGGVNFRGSKSYLGVFEPPEATIVDPSFLRTAPLTTSLDGVAEAVKIAVIADTALFALLEKHAGAIAFGTAADAGRTRTVVHRAIAAMLAELAPNLFEDATFCRAVDFGHTFGPLLESRTDYAISHGVSVAIDMALSASIAVTLGKAAPAVFERLAATLRGWSLPIWSPLLTTELCETALANAAAHRGGTPNLVIPTRIGACTFVRDLRVTSRTVLGESLQRLAQVAGATTTATEITASCRVVRQRGAPPS